MKKVILGMIAMVGISSGQVAFADGNEQAQAIALCKKSIEIENRQMTAKGQRPNFIAGTENIVCAQNVKPLSQLQCAVPRQEAGETAAYALEACKDK